MELIEEDKKKDKSANWGNFKAKPFLMYSEAFPRGDQSAVYKSC